MRLKEFRRRTPRCPQLLTMSRIFFANGETNAPAVLLYCIMGCLSRGAFYVHQCDLRGSNASHLVVTREFAEDI